MTTGRVIAIAVALAIGISASQFSRLLRRAQFLYWQHLCMVFTIPSGNAVLDVRQSVGETPVDFNASGAGVLPWEALYNLMSRPGMRAIATVFVHQRISPAGHVRLVAINLHIVGGSLECGTRLIIPGDLVKSPKEIISAAKIVPFAAMQNEKVFAGVPDPADPSHFTFILDGPGAGEMNGWLLDDDTIRLEFHSNASTQPAPGSPALSP